MKNNKNHSQINTIWDVDNLPIKYPIKIRNTYEKIYKENRKSYTNWVDKIGRRFCNDIDWWMTLPSLRNPYASKLLNYLCVIDTIRKLNYKNLILKTDSNAFANLLTSNFKKYNVKVEVNSRKNVLAPLLGKFIKSTLFQLFIYFFIKFFKKKSEINEKKVILIDKFFTFKSKQNSNYFPSFVKAKNVRIVPTIIPTLNFIKLIKIFRSLSKNKEKILYKEQYIKFSDLFFSFTHLLRRRRFLKYKYNYKSINISSLIFEELSSYDDFYSINNGLLNYRFFLRLSENNINIFKSFNWFENQIIDKGWNFGFRKFFSQNQKNSFGYQDFNKHYNLVSNSPSILEKSSKVTPEKIIIISDYFKKITKDFLKNQKLITGQSERFKDLNNLKLLSFKKRTKILTVLCGIKKIDQELVKLVVKACSIDRNLRIIIKPHPILDLSHIFPLDNLPQNLTVYNDDLKKILRKSLICITAGPSSALLESVSCGVYNILPEIECGTDKNISIFEIKKNQYSLIRNSYELLKQIRFVLKNKQKINIKKKVIVKSHSKEIKLLFN